MSDKKTPKKPRKKAIEPPLTLKSRKVILSKHRQELYQTWFANQSRHLLTQVIEAPPRTPVPPVGNELHEVQTAFEAMQVLSSGEDLESTECPQLNVLYTQPRFPWPATAPEGFGPR